MASDRTRTAKVSEFYREYIPALAEQYKTLTIENFSSHVPARIRISGNGYLCIVMYDRDERYSINWYKDDRRVKPEYTSPDVHSIGEQMEGGADMYFYHNTSPPSVRMTKLSELMRLLGASPSKLAAALAANASDYYPSDPVILFTVPKWIYWCCISFESGEYVVCWYDGNQAVNETLDERDFACKTVRHSTAAELLAVLLGDAQAYGLGRIVPDI